jgi:ABC-2 type transport system permease protein
VFWVEIGKSTRRIRTWFFAVGLAGLAVLPVVLLLHDHHPNGGGPPFYELISHNGLFAALTAVALLQPFFLPLGAALLSGEAIAGEASVGTLRYLLARPVGRRRLVAVKYGAVMAELAAGVAWVMIVGLIAGAVAFGFGSLPTLSGTTIGVGAGVLRVLGTALYVLAGIAGVAAIGVFISTLTDSGPGATVATVALAIISQVLDGLSSLRAIHPYLPTHGWMAWADLFRSPVAWDAIRKGLILDAVYTAIFLGAALVVFSRKDVTS